MKFVVAVALCLIAACFPVRCVNVVEYCVGAGKQCVPAGQCATMVRVCDPCLLRDHSWDFGTYHLGRIDIESSVRNEKC